MRTTAASSFWLRSIHRADDPCRPAAALCYAAPELVISQGLYVGSATAAAHKYIVNTPLSSPEYISEEAHDLLKMMFVPDPCKHTTLAALMRHPWLMAYHMPSADPDPSMPDAFRRLTS
ncbi:hypothetical protein B0H11DRAFT_2229535 [Mycena galericulata]|nr:hypothetical protein B0H11DRAFT_2229535 [Mycena galericulata]